MNSFLHGDPRAFWKVAWAAVFVAFASPALAQSAPASAAPLESLFAPPLSASSEAVLASASGEVQEVARWVAASGDNLGLPYLLIDKVNARVYAFGADGRLRATAPALLGMTPGDKIKVPNETLMAHMSANDRVTPAGRFVSRLAIDSHGKELLVLDYDASISLHAVVKGTPKEHRAERLASPTPKDNRVSFGCINVPAAFYSGVVSPAFQRTKGIVYVLPETSTAAAFFGIQPTGSDIAATPAVASTQAGATPAAATPVLTASDGH